MRGLRIAALLGAGIAAASVSVASIRPRRRGARPQVGTVEWVETGEVMALGEFTVWPPPSGGTQRGRRGR